MAARVQGRGRASRACATTTTPTTTLTLTLTPAAACVCVCVCVCVWSTTHTGGCVRARRETALNPDLAEAVTVGGMGKVLDAMREVGARRICFTDSIGSYGAEV